MAASAQTTATATTTFEVFGDGLLELAQELAPEAERMSVRLTPVALIAKCVAAALAHHPSFNATIDATNGDLLLHPTVDLGVAVAAPTGLLVPVVRDAGGTTVLGVAERVADLARRARDGRLALEELRGGTFTLSSTGNLEQAMIVSTTPLINLPQSAILWTSRITDRPRVRGGAAGSWPGDGLQHQLRSQVHRWRHGDGVHQRPHLVPRASGASTGMTAVGTQLLVIGGGPGGYVAAIRGAQRGLSVTLVERGDLGGVCLNEGCVPSKALIHGAAEFAIARAAGAPVSGTSWLQDVQGHMQSVVTRMRDGIRGLLGANGVSVLAGTGVLNGPTSASVAAADGGHTEVRFEHVILATGSAATELPDLPFDGVRVRAARDVLDLDEVPGEVVVAGGGYIGLELAGALHRLGANVHLVEMLDRILPGFDSTIVGALERQLRKSGVDLRLGHKVVSDTGSGVEIEGSDGVLDVAADLIVVAVGRRPLTGSLGLDSVGLDPTPSGLLEVDTQRRTAVSNVLAVGDIVPGPALAHKAMAEGVVAADVAADVPASFEPGVIPSVVYTDPEIATVGLTAQQAEERGIRHQQVRFPLGANARSVMLGGGSGFGLLVFERDTNLVLGMHLLGPGVGEIIGAGALAIEMGARIDDLAHTIFPHPSVSEVIGELGELALGRPLHTLPARR